MGWYYLGGVTMFFFIVQVITGVLLLMYYQPGEATAYESIRFLTTKVPFGWLIRSMHSWSAHLMIISLVLHMFSTMMLKAYRPPRELTWVSGYLLFLLTLGFGFSGYLLPWNKLAYFATTVGTNIVQSVPLLGDWLLEVLRGGQDVTINTLVSLLRGARRDPAAGVCRLDRSAPAVHSTPGHGAAARRQSRAARNEVLSQFCAARRVVVAGLPDDSG